jgi:hypothetical protein
VRFAGAHSPLRGTGRTRSIVSSQLSARVLGDLRRLRAR